MVLTIAYQQLDIKKQTRVAFPQPATEEKNATAVTDTLGGVSGVMTWHRRLQKPNAMRALQCLRGQARRSAEMQRATCVFFRVSRQGP